LIPKDSLIFIASSWKERSRVRELANTLREFEFPVYDFTDPSCRESPEIPPEKYPEPFDPEKKSYWEYLHSYEWYKAMEENRKNIDCCSMLILLLPCGIDATADWAYAVGKEKETYIIGEPRAGERSPVHLWTTGWFPEENSFVFHLSEWLSSYPEYYFYEYLIELRILKILKMYGPLENLDLLKRVIMIDSDKKYKQAKKVFRNLVDQGKINITLDLKAAIAQ